MDRIRPPTSPATLMRGGEVVAGDCICELGVFGVFAADELSDAAQKIVKAVKG